MASLSVSQPEGVKGRGKQAREVEGPGSGRCWAGRGGKGRRRGHVGVKGQGLGAAAPVLPAAPWGRPPCPPPLTSKARGDRLRAVSCGAGQSSGSKAELLGPPHPAGCRGDSGGSLGCKCQMEMPGESTRPRLGNTHSEPWLRRPGRGPPEGTRGSRTRPDRLEDARLEPRQQPLPGGRTQPVFIRCAQTFFFFSFL